MQGMSKQTASESTLDRTDPSKEEGKPNQPVSCSDTVHYKNVLQHSLQCEPGEDFVSYITRLYRVSNGVLPTTKEYIEQIATRAQVLFTASAQSNRVELHTIHSFLRDLMEKHELVTRTCTDTNSMHRISTP